MEAQTAIVPAQVQAMALQVPPRKHLCPTCSLAFSKPAYVRQHMLVHGDQRAHVCPHDGCERAYKRVDHLNRHLLSHDGIVFQCERGCGTTFTTKEALYKHRVRQQECVARKQAQAKPLDSPAQAQAAVASRKASGELTLCKGASRNGYEIAGSGNGTGNGSGVEDRRWAAEGGAERRSDSEGAPVVVNRASKRTGAAQGPGGGALSVASGGGGGVSTNKKLCVSPASAFAPFSRSPVVNATCDAGDRATNQPLEASKKHHVLRQQQQQLNLDAQAYEQQPQRQPSLSAEASSEPPGDGQAAPRTPEGCAEAGSDRIRGSAKGFGPRLDEEMGQEAGCDGDIHLRNSSGDGVAGYSGSREMVCARAGEDPWEEEERSEGGEESEEEESEGEEGSEEEESEGGEEGEEEEGGEEERGGEGEGGEMEEGEKSRGENGEGSSWSGSDNDSDSGSPPVARPAPVHFVCGACVKLFPSKADLDSHMKEAHESSPCPLCAKTVKSAYLTRHIKDYHSGAPKAKAFRCPLKPCDKAYTSKFNLLHHMHFGHFQHRRFLCAFDGCGKAFSTKQLMQKHFKAAHEYEEEESSPEKHDMFFLEEKRSWTGRRPYAAQQFVNNVFAGLTHEKDSS